MTEQWALPYDVLLTIMDLSSPCTIATMMRTCRTLYDDTKGLWLLLHNGVTLADNPAILSFAAFMLASHNTRRFQYLRTLTVAKGGFYDDAVRELTTILTHPSLNIETLTLHDAEKVLSCGAVVTVLTEDVLEPRLPLLHTFSSLTTLKHITISSMGQRTHTLLDLLPPGLISASLAFGSPYSREETPFGDANARNPVVRLAKFADTLEVLEGSWFDAQPVVGRPPVVYARVRRLCATYCVRHPARPATAGYAYIFPNVEYLALAARWPEHSGFQLYPKRTTRQANRQDQVKYGGWRRLRVVEGSFEDVWALGLTCHVRMLRLTGDIPWDDSTAPRLEEVLVDVQPVELAFTGFSYPLHTFGGEPVWAALQGPAAQCVQTLEVEIRFGSAQNDGEANMADVLVSASGARVRFAFNCSNGAAAHRRISSMGLRRPSFPNYARSSSL
ncbi:hypothetical protein TRAPUB_11293 [Trametes pubescens]|uniref:F-box domain-containing protein n=1 Tax=Trametes pubescens TaxID=154538 RepID=A0A1M2VX82_TRAPU|nr:hypothetical protein TRAPUB_11293 [Trametes pubescens]